MSGVKPWTVAKLREALRDKPDDMPVYLWCCSQLTIIECECGARFHSTGGAWLQDLRVALEEPEYEVTRRGVMVNSTEVPPRKWWQWR